MTTATLPATVRLAVISPHCDDAVLGCGELLARHSGATVVTALAGAPPAYAEPTPWDAAAGFRAGDDVMARRRDEDRRALFCLRATPVWLDFCDAQYGSPIDLAALTQAIEGALTVAAPTLVGMPLGLFHSDHHLTADAALAIRRRGYAAVWLAYEDAIYRRLPGLVAKRLAALAADGWQPRPIAMPSGGWTAQKRRAVRCYRSQLRALARPGLPGYQDAFAAERYWALE
jgi:LmbE family N-acetylglucosaminyl deacetylase